MMADAAATLDHQRLLRMAERERKSLLRALKRDLGKPVPPAPEARR